MLCWLWAQRAKPRQRGAADGGIRAIVPFRNPVIDPECAAIQADIPAEAKAAMDRALAMAAMCALARVAGAIASPAAAISGMEFSLRGFDHLWFLN